MTPISCDECGGIACLADYHPDGEVMCVDCAIKKGKLI